MGQKINPNGLRFGINKNWLSRWSAKDNKQMAKWIVEDEKIRIYFLKNFKTAQIVEAEIERSQKAITVNLKAGQPGIVLGKEGINTKDIILAINKIVGRNVKVNFNVIPYEVPSLSARLIAREIADAIEGRVSFRVAQKMAIKKALASKAKGVRTHVSGRLGGVEMAREEGYSEGMIPLSTIYADIDYALEEAHTTYGLIGVKVWINRGEIFKGKKSTDPKARKTFDDRPRRTFDSNKKPGFVRQNKPYQNTTANSIHSVDQTGTNKTIGGK